MTSQTLDNDIQFGIQMEKEGKMVDVLKMARFDSHQQVISVRRCVCFVCVCA